MPSRTSWSIGLAFFVLFGVPNAAHAGGLVFVDIDAVGANDGSSWIDAYTDLQDALSAARNSGGAFTEIWVAAGTYRPTIEGGDRTATFQLVSGVGVFGGFAGGETGRIQRDPDLNVTILSGDLNGDDGFGFRGSDCCIGHGTPGCDNDACEAAVCAVDPFCCDDAWDRTCERRTVCLCGQMCSSRCDNVFHIVTGSGASAAAILDGFMITGGNANGGDAPTNRGGGLVIVTGQPIVTGCVFANNIAESLGGAVYTNSTPRLTNCRFIGNSAASGGGLASELGRPTLVNCTFSGNVASDSGGAVIQIGGGATMSNCTLSANVAAVSGGIRNRLSGTPVITNCILSGNIDNGGVDESAQLSNDPFSRPFVNYTCIQGLTPVFGGLGNIGGDPLFEDSDGPDGQPGTLDDNFRLSQGSPCIDAGANGGVPPDAADLDSDGNRTERVPFDLSGRPRFVDEPATMNTGSGSPPIVDMGAHEVGSDCNRNGFSDELDVASQTSDDCDGNDIPDECEIDEESTAPGGPFFCTLDCDADCNNNGLPDGCELDGDADGVIDSCDDCPGTPVGTPVDAEGCELRGACCLSEGVCFNGLFRESCTAIFGLFLGHGMTCTSDPDGDAAVGCGDRCPQDGTKTHPGACGCGVPDADADHDGVADCIDPCPADDPNDTDGDGVCDSADPCPLDSPDDTDGDGACNSQDPCPIDNPDDTDGDETCDSADGCPTDPAKTEPGVCGCGVADADMDGDAVADCNDECPGTAAGVPVGEDGCPQIGACCFLVGVCVENTRPVDCDLVGGTYQGNQATCALGCGFHGDFDRDERVDLDDFEMFVGCLTGPSGDFAPGCRIGDFDRDRDVDLHDVTAFQAAFTGP